MSESNSAPTGVNTCPSCHKKFKTQNGLSYHINKKVCQKKMVVTKRKVPVPKQTLIPPPPPLATQSQINQTAHTSVTSVAVPVPQTSSIVSQDAHTVQQDAQTVQQDAQQDAQTVQQDAQQDAQTVQQDAQTVQQDAQAVDDEYIAIKASIEEIVENQLDPRKKKLLYVEQGNKHKTDLDPNRFDKLRFIRVQPEEVPDISFDEIMEKTESLLSDPFFWVRWRDVCTH